MGGWSQLVALALVVRTVVGCYFCEIRVRTVVVVCFVFLFFFTQRLWCVCSTVVEVVIERSMIYLQTIGIIPHACCGVLSKY